jgi:hypothetical protein
MGATLLQSGEEERYLNFAVGGGVNNMRAFALEVTQAGMKISIRNPHQLTDIKINPHHSADIPNSLNVSYSTKKQ